MSYKILSEIHSGIALFSESWATQGLGMDDDDDGVPKQSKVESHIEEILSHMARHVKGEQKQPLLFTGAPGIGKTTLIETFSKLIGLPYVVIEVPHIVEEHLINIPFIVSDPITDTRKSLNDTEIGKSQSGQKLVLADSVLWTELNKKAKTKLDDSQYLSYMYSNKIPQYILQMFEDMGGDEQTVPPQIRKVRNMYHAILFIDEYMRVTSKRIRNIMRGFLDRRLGLHSLPDSLYVTFASNTRSSSPTESSRSLDVLDANQEFKFIEFEPPTKDEWFGWFLLKHKDVDEKLVHHFQEKLTDTDISFDDVDTSVRTSPRRWENLLLFIDKAVKHPNLNVDMPHLIATIRNNFIVYDHTGTDEDSRPTHSPHADKVVEAVTEFLKEERNMHIGGTGSHAVEWRDTLKHYMQVQMESSSRKYIPVLSGLPGVGKAQPLTAKILTPTGWVHMGDIHEGDDIIVPDGTIAKVCGVYPQGDKDVFVITFHDGSKTECCLDHLWSVYYRPKSAQKTLPGIIDTREIIKQIQKGYNVSIPLIKPLETNCTKDLPIPPYTMGALLGDGSFQKYGVRITSADPELIEYVRQELPEGMNCENYRGHPIEYGFTHDHQNEDGNVYAQAIRQLDLWDKNSFTKFIPDVYKSASTSQKWDLLRGLMDTDGTVCKKSKCSFSTSSYQLMKDVQELVWSLGGCASLLVKYPHYKYKGEVKQGAISYQLHISMPEPCELFKLTRKKTRCNKKHGKGRIQLFRRVKSVEYKGKEPSQCIMVDHPDHLYITDDYIVTHNTTSLLSLEANLNVVVVDVNVSTFDAEEAMGIPTATERTKDEDSNDKISVGFSKPVLYQMMMNKLQEKTKMFKERLNSSPEGQEKLKQWQAQDVKYIVLFDELNRVNDKTFNVLRKVMLEKEFGHDESGKVLKMPEGTLFVGAINPTGATTSPLTQHFRDVIDIIPVAPSWSSTVDYLSKSIKHRDDISETVSRTVVPMLTSFVDYFSEDSKASRHKDEYRFHLKFGEENIYVSPRMLAGLADSVAGRLQRTYDKFATMEDKIPSGQVRARHYKAAIIEEIDRFVIAARAEQHGMDLEALRGDLLKWVNATFEDYGAALLQHIADTDPHLTQEMEIKSLVNMFLSSNKTQFEQQMIKGITDNPTIVHLLEEDPERIRKDLVEGFIDSFEQAVSGGGVKEATEWLKRMYMPNQTYYNHMNEEGISIKDMHALHDWNSQPQVSNAKLKFDPTEKMSMIEYIFSVVLHIAHELDKGKETIDTILSAFKSLTFVDGELYPVIKKYVDVESIEQKNSNELTEEEAAFAEIYEYVFQGKAANYHKHNRLHNYRLNQRQQK